MQNKLKFNNNFNLSFKKDKKQHFFLSFFSLYLVLVCVILPVFSFTACAENGTFYVGIMATRSSNASTGDTGTTRPDEMFMIDIHNVSKNILNAIADTFGLYEINAVSERAKMFKEYLNIKYDLTDEEVEELNLYFNLFKFFTYCEYERLGVKRKVLVLSNEELDKSYIEQNIVNYNPNTGEFASSMPSQLFVSKEITQLSNVDEEKEIKSGDILPTNNVYKYFNGNGLFKPSTYALVFIGNEVGESSFAESYLVDDFIQKFYDSTYGSIEKLVTIPGNFTIGQPAEFTTNYWFYSLVNRGREIDNVLGSPENYKDNFVDYYYKDVGVFICRYLLTRDTNPESLKNLIPTDFTEYATMYDMYLEAQKHLYGGEFPNNDSGILDNREYFIRMSCQFLMGAGSLGGELSEGGIVETAEVLYQEMLGDNFVKAVDFDNNYHTSFVEKVKENSWIPDGDYADETSVVYFCESFAYNTKKDLPKMQTHKTIMTDFLPVRALVFQSWDMSDTLDAVVVNFEYYQEGKTDEETQANKERAWEILKNYNFIVRYSVISNVGTSQRAQSVILDKEQFVDQGELEDGVLFLDLYTIFETHFKDQFKGYSSEGFYMRDLDLANLEGHVVSRPFQDNFYFTTFNTGSRGVGVYYDGMVRDNSIPEYYFEIIFAAPGYNQVLNFKITDIFL